MRYDEATIEQVRNANDIVDVVGQYVRLTRKGANYFGLCPFHGEKTPSFSVAPRKQIYYCFGCGAGGNVVNFLMNYENYSYVEAVQALAQRANIALPEASGSGSDRKVNKQKKALLDMHKEAATYYYKKLGTREGEAGYRYLREKRGLSDSAITHFGLGYAPKPDGQSSLYAFLKEKGFSDEDMKESGLVTFSERGVNDRFWNRVMFPIMDTNNHVIGFGGRVMGEGEPKYLNSPETFIFDKSSNLYGLNFAKKSRKKNLILCEGYMDVIALHQAGITNVIGSLGTALTGRHARLLKRYTDNIILSQDSDKAGIAAKLRAFPILYAAGLNVRVLDVPGAKDPDEFIRANGPEAFEAVADKAGNAFMYMIDVLKSGYDLSDPASKTEFYSETADRLCMFAEKLERDNYTDAVSREFFIDREELRSLVERRFEAKGTAAAGSILSSFDEPVRRNVPSSMKPAGAGSAYSAGRTSARAEQAPLNAGFSAEGIIDSNEELNGSRDASAELRLTPQEKLLVSWLSEKPELLPAVEAAFDPGMLRNRVCREIISELKKGGSFEPGRFMSREDLDEYEIAQAAEIFSYGEEHGDISGLNQTELEKGLTETVRAIKQGLIDEEIASGRADGIRLTQLLREKNELRRLKISMDA